MPVVFIVNVNDALRGSLTSAVLKAGWQVQAFADAYTYLAHPRTRTLSCLVLDEETCGRCGLDLQTLFTERPETPVIVTAKQPTLRAAILAIKAGALEFLAEPLDEALLLSAVSDALERSCETLFRQAEQHALAARYALLSRREREVMTGVVTGRLNKQIAHELGISIITVKAHRGRVMRKMRAASVPELVTLAARLCPALTSGDPPRAPRSIPTTGGRPGVPQFHRLPTRESQSATS